LPESYTSQQVVDNAATINGEKAAMMEYINDVEKTG